MPLLLKHRLGHKKRHHMVSTCSKISIYWSQWNTH